MLVYAKLDAVVLDFEAVGIVRRKRLVGLVRRVKITPRLAGNGVNDRFNHTGRDDNALFAEPEFPDKAVKANIERVQRLHSVRIDAHAERAVVVDIVCRRRAEVRKQGVFNAVDRGRLVKKRINLGERDAHTENILRLPAARSVLICTVKLVRDRVGHAVPLVPFEAGVVIAALRLPGDKDGLADLGVVPGGRDKLIRHAIADFQALAALDLAALAVVAHVAPYFQRSAAESCRLFDRLAHLHAEVVLFKRALSDEFLQGIFLVFRKLDPGGGNGDFRLIRPYHSRQLRAHGFR